MKRKQFIILILLSLFIFSFSLFEKVSALTLSPAKLEISGDPGSSLKGEITLYNERDTEETFYSSFENFEPSDDSGKPHFVGAKNGLATWMNTNPIVTLGPKERRKIPFTINVPLDADAGGYFAALFFGTQPADEESGKVSIGGRLGSLLLMRVNGDIPEAGGLLEYRIQDDSYFHVMNPVHFEYRFSNNGGDYVTPRGEIKIKNSFGSVKDIFNANPQEGSVLPSSARRFHLTWGEEVDMETGYFAKAKAQLKNFHLGFYKAEIHLGWGYQNNSTFEKVSFFMFPWQLLSLLLVLIIFISFVFKFAGRSYKKKLIKQLQKEAVKK